MTLPLAIGFGPLSLVEVMVVLAAALMVFGSRLPDVALRAVAHVMRARRAVSKMWRETGLEDELRRVRRDIELGIPRQADFDVRDDRQTQDHQARAAAERARTAALGAPEPADHDDAEDPDEGRTAEPFDSSIEIRPAEGLIGRGDVLTEPQEERVESHGEVEEASPVEEPEGTSGDGDREAG